MLCFSVASLAHVVLALSLVGRWNSFSGNIFVGDVKVPESGSIYSLDICKGMWAPSRNDPTMGVPFSEGDIITIQIDIGVRPPGWGRWPAMSAGFSEHFIVGFRRFIVAFPGGF